MGSPAPPALRTARLLLRPPTPADVGPLHRIQRDAEAMRFTFWAPDREATRRHVESHAARFALDGFAPWTAALAGSDEVVGWGGLCRDPDAPHWGVEVVYYLGRDHWGRGLATELVRAALAHGFGDLGLPAIGAFARPANRASIQVLEKCGFRRLRFVAELERDQFRIGRGEWREREQALRREGTSGPDPA